MYPHLAKVLAKERLHSFAGGGIKNLPAMLECRLHNRWRVIDGMRFIIRVRSKQLVHRSIPSGVLQRQDVNLGANGSQLTRT